MASSMAMVAPMEEPTAYYEDMDAVSSAEMAILLDACHALLADVDAHDRAPDDAERSNAASLRVQGLVVHCDTEASFSSSSLTF